MFKIKDIIKWERLRGRGFHTFNIDDREDLAALLYVTSGQDGSCTLESFTRVMGSNAMLHRREMSRVSMSWQVLGQWSARVVPKDGSSDDTDRGEAQTVAVEAYALIAAGADADYVLEKLPLWELPALAKAYAEQGKVEAERFKSSCEVWRMMAYVSVAPHVKRGSLKGARSLWSYPWDKQQETEDERTAHEAEFRQFMAGGAALWSQLRPKG